MPGKSTITFAVSAVEDLEEIRRWYTDQHIPEVGEKLIADVLRSVERLAALRLGRFFSMEAQFWLNLQTHYDMEVALEALGGRLDQEVTPLNHAA